MRRRQAGFSFVEILVVMSIIVVLAGMVTVIVPTIQEKGRQTESINNVRNLVQLLIGEKMDRSWPRYSGKNFHLSLVPAGLIDARNPNNMKVYFSPGDETLKLGDVDVNRYKEISYQALKQGGMDNHELTSYAGRRNGEQEFRITPDKESQVVPIVGDDDYGNLHHPRGMILGYTDGAVRFVQWRDLDIAAPEEVDGEVDPFLGDDATAEVLEGLSSE